MNPTEEWLKAINEKFRKEDVHPKARPFLALKAFSKQFQCDVAISSDIANVIRQWFYNNTQEGSLKIGYLYEGVYYFDSCFWPVFIQIMYSVGRTFNIFDSLVTMSDILKTEIKSDKKELCNLRSLWVDCFDYAYGYNDIIQDSKLKGLAINLIKSADKELRSIAPLLLHDKPEPKAIENARMSVEMFLKAIIILENQWDENKIRNKIGHDLIAAGQEAFNCTHNNEIQQIMRSFALFPDIHERYSGKDWKSRELWRGYCVAQVVATIFTRLYSGRDSR